MLSRKADLARAAQSPGARGLDPRAQRTRARVLQAALALLHEKGFGGCTVEAIMARTGVAKTTIYRHWQSRRDLLADAFADLSKQGPMPDTGELRGDLIEYLTVRAHGLDNYLSRSLQTLPGLIEAAKSDPALLSAYQEMTNALVSGLRQIFEAGRARGEVGAARDIDVAVNLVLGAIYVQRTYLDRDLTDAYIVEVVDTLLESLSGL